MNVLLFGAFPYVAIVLLVMISIVRYRRSAYTVSSLSSQFFESRELFWGSVPFHLGILILFFGHLIGFAIPRQVQVWNGHPMRLFVLELTGFVAGLLTLWGLVLLVQRRARSDRLRVITEPTDLVVYALLLFQVVTGLYVALVYRWGSAWYVQVLVPYLRSVFTLSPDVARVADLPWMVRLHVLGAFTLFAVFSFTRLMHVLVAPIPYLWRRPQIVMWNRPRPAATHGAPGRSP